LHGLAVKVSGHRPPLPTVGLSTPRVRDAVPPAHVAEQVAQLDQAPTMQSSACIEGEPDGTAVIGSVGVGVVGLGVGEGVGFDVGAGVGVDVGTVGATGAGVAGATGAGVEGATGAGVAGATGAGVASATGGGVAGATGAGMASATGAGVASATGAGVASATGGGVAGASGGVGLHAETKCSMAPVSAQCIMRGEPMIVCECGAGCRDLRVSSSKPVHVCP
jgi:hypothetical protein